MELMRDAWTDERLDDLNHRVDEGFREMREEFRAVRGEMRVEFAAVRAEMAVMNRTFIALFGITVIGFVATIATVLARS